MRGGGERLSHSETACGNGKRPSLWVGADPGRPCGAPRGCSTWDGGMHTQDGLVGLVYNGRWVAG